MKKKLIAVLLVGMMVLAAGCGNKGKVTIGEYKGLVLTSISQATLDEEIQSMLEYYSEFVVVDRAAEEGDTVNINFVGLLNGEPFEGGSDETEAGTDLELGSNTFIDGFEDGLIGTKAGEAVELQLVFPEDYGVDALNGQAVVFQVTVNEVKELQTPEFTDEFVAEKVPEYPTVAEYTEALRKSLNEEAYYTQITEQLMASCEVQKYNEAQVLLRKEMFISEYTSYAEYYASYYGIDTESAIMYILGFESTEAFEEEMGNYAYDVEKNAMIVNEIAKLEKIEVSDELYNEKVVEYAEYYGYEDVAEFEEANGKQNVVDSILSELVMDFIIENAVITEAQ